MSTLTSHVLAIKLRKPVNVGVIIMKMTRLSSSTYGFAQVQLLWQTTGTLHRCEMYDRPYNKLDIGQLPQIAVVDSFYHGLVCESP